MAALPEVCQARARNMHAAGNVSKVADAKKSNSLSCTQSEHATESRQSSKGSCRLPSVSSSRSTTKESTPVNSRSTTKESTPENSRLSTPASPISPPATSRHRSSSTFSETVDSPARCQRNRQSMLCVFASQMPECSPCCTKEAFWPYLAAFQSMDRLQVGKVRRSDFIWALHEHGSKVEFQRAVSKAGLREYFRKPVDLTLDEFIHLIFPRATGAEVLPMLRWVRLHKANTIVAEPSFKATAVELRQVFSVLDENNSGRVSLADLLQAHLFSSEEMLDLLRTVVPPSNQFEFEDFSILMQSKFGPRAPQNRTLMHVFDKYGREHPYLEKLHKIQRDL